MAFNTQSAAATQSKNDSWKAQAFLNIYLPRGEGRIKVGAIPLKEAKKFEAAIIKRLTEDPDSLQLMVDRLEYEFNLVDDPKAPPATLPF